MEDRVAISAFICVHLWLKIVFISFIQGLFSSFSLLGLPVAGFDRNISR
jgi:hypothetical protein